MVRAEIHCSILFMLNQNQGGGGVVVDGSAGEANWGLRDFSRFAVREVAVSMPALKSTRVSPTCPCLPKTSLY